MKNIVAATFQPGYTTAKVLGLWQYDYGQILRIQGLELPDAVEIHFSLQEKGGESERQVGLTRDGVTEVAVPNSYLENAGTSRDYSIYAFLYISDGKSGNTEYKITMYVQSRPKPKDPETPEDPKDDPFGKTIEAVNKAMESTKASAEVAADSAKSASESATRAEKSAVESQKSAKAAATSEKAAATSATAAAESASQARESATAARSAADEATESATAAAESETAAARLAANAARSATNASGSAESASQSAETAKTAADTAEKSASAAQQVAGSASESASTATAAAQTATTAAGNAAESVMSAAQSAETAGQKATAAETAASNAAESATAAEKSATAAGDSASAAKTSETAAEEAAQTAQEQAEKIKDSAEQIEKNKAVVAAIIIEESATGADIVISDSAEMPLKNLKLFGKSEQKTTNGYQLLGTMPTDAFGNKKELPFSENGITIDVLDDGGIKIKGTNTSENVTNVYLAKRGSVDIKKGIYTASCKNATNDCYFIIGGTATNEVIPYTEIRNGNSYKLIAEKDGNQGYAVVQIGIGATIDTVLYPMLEYGEVAHDFEPYTDGKPSPSPDFPQEIISAGDSGNIEVDVTGKNLVNIQDVTVGWAQGIQTSLDDLNKHVGETITITAIFDVISVSNKVSEQYVFQIYTLNTDNEYRAIAAKKLSIVPKVGDRVVVQNVTKLTKKIQKMLLYAFGNDHIGTLGTSKATVQIELGGVATPYKPFEKETLNLITPTGLPGIPVDSDGNYTDENGQQWVCDEVDFERGVYAQRIWTGEFDGSDDEWWTRYDTSGYQGFSANLLPETMYRRNGFANYYAVENRNLSSTEALWLGVGNMRIYVHNSRFYDAELGDKGLSNFKAYLAEHPLIVVTYLDAPIETPLTADQITAYKPLTTHKTTTLISNDAGAGMEVSYVVDPKTYIDNKFAELSQAIVASASEAE